MTPPVPVPPLPSHIIFGSLGIALTQYQGAIFKWGLLVVCPWLLSIFWTYSADPVETRKHLGVGSFTTSHIPSILTFQVHLAACDHRTSFVRTYPLLLLKAK
jgi:hypothetical protein